MSPEELLGLIWSLNLAHQNMRGYLLAVTSTRVVGAKRAALLHGLEVYLGPGSKATDDDRQKARQLFDEALANKELEIMKDSITKISWKGSGFLHKGYFLFNTIQGDIKIDTSTTRNNLTVVHTINTVIPSLEAFVPDRFYNEKTGGNMREEFLARLAKKQRR